MLGEEMVLPVEKKTNFWGLANPCLGSSCGCFGEKASRYRWESTRIIGLEERPLMRQVPTEPPSPFSTDTIDIVNVVGPKSLGKFEPLLPSPSTTSQQSEEGACPGSSSPEGRV